MSFRQKKKFENGLEMWNSVKQFCDWNRSVEHFVLWNSGIKKLINKRYRSSWTGTAGNK
jgi:hypothetical protein